MTLSVAVMVMTCIVLLVASFVPYANGARLSEAINSVDMNNQSRSSTSNPYNNHGDAIASCGSYCETGSSCDNGCRCDIIPALEWGICLGGCCDSVSTK